MATTDHGLEGIVSKRLTAPLQLWTSAKVGSRSSVAKRDNPTPPISTKNSRRRPRLVQQAPVCHGENTGHVRPHPCDQAGHRSRPNATIPAGSRMSIGELTRLD
jgi:hypothetical protein